MSEPTGFEPRRGSGNLWFPVSEVRGTEGSTSAGDIRLRISTSSEIPVDYQNYHDKINLLTTEERLAELKRMCATSHPLYTAFKSAFGRLICTKKDKILSEKFFRIHLTKKEGAIFQDHFLLGSLKSFDIFEKFGLCLGKVEIREKSILLFMC